MKLIKKKIFWIWTFWKASQKTGIVIRDKCNPSSSDQMHFDVIISNKVLRSFSSYLVWKSWTFLLLIQQTFLEDSHLSSWKIIYKSLNKKGAELKTYLSLAYSVASFWYLVEMSGPAASVAVILGPQLLWSLQCNITCQQLFRPYKQFRQ